MNLVDIFKQKTNQDYYSILEVEKTATKQEMRKSRRQLLSKYHPDKFSGDDKKVCEQISMLVNDAYESLADEAFKADYDNSGHKLTYYDTHQPTTSKKKTKEKIIKARGMNLTTIAKVPSLLLKEGGINIEVKPFAVKGKELKDPTRLIKINPNTKSGSFHIYTGLGEQLNGDDNGDLIVLFQAMDNVDEDDRLSVYPTPNVILAKGIESEENGQHALTVPSLLSEQININKKQTGKALLYIKEVNELDKSLLISY